MFLLVMLKSISVKSRIPGGRCGSFGAQAVVRRAPGWQQDLATFRIILTNFPVLCWVFC
jgi:hypothetical protein